MMSELTRGAGAPNLTDEVRFVRFVGGEGSPLDGALWSPRGGQADAVLLHLHGKGGNFYSATGRFIPERTRHRRLAHFSMNMSCHDLGYSREDRRDALRWEDADQVGGGMWETIELGRADIAAAIDALLALGHECIYLAGHSSGGFYAADYATTDERVAGRILLSPLTGHKADFLRWFSSDDERDNALEKAQQLVASGRGHHLVPLASWYFGISAHALLERQAEPDDRFWTALDGSPTPLLMVWGSGEPRHEEWSRLFRECSAGDKEQLVVLTRSHFYSGDEQVVADTVADFVLSRTPASRAVT